MRSAVAAFRFRDFRLFWTGSVVSSTGTWMQNVTVPYVLFQLTHSGMWVGLAVVAQILPSLALSPTAGSLADRFSRRRVLLVAQCVQLGGATALWAAWVGGLHSPVLMLLIVAGGGTAAMVSQPAWQAFVADLVPKEHLLNAITLNSAQANAARAVGPALGGVVLGTLGPGWAFLVNAASFVGVIVVLGLMRPAEVEREPLEGRVLQQFKEAAAYSRRHTGLLVAFVLTATVCGLGYPAFQLATVFAERVYDVGPGLYGALTAAYGVGGICGAALLATLGATRERGPLVRRTLTAYGLALVGFGLTRTVWQGVLLLAAVGATSLPVIAALNTSIQTQVPDRLRGRVLALWVVSYTLSYPLGSFLQGWLADRIGPGTTVAAAGTAVLLVAGGLFLRPALTRSLDQHVHRPPRVPVAVDAAPAAPAAP